MNRLIRWSIDNRLLVMVASVVLVVVGAVVARDMPVDVFPDLTAPTVTIVTEAHGLAPEEVETLVTFPIEAAMNGSTGVRRVRSASGVGISIVWVEFDWSVPLWQARQTANEKLQVAASQLPADIAPPQVAPTSSVMGEVLFLAVSFDEAHRATDERGIAAQRLEARTIADHVIRRRLLSVAGVSQVIPIGGDVRQAQVLLRPESLQAWGLSFDDVARALRTTSQNASGGFVQDGTQELLVRAIGRAADLQALGATVVAVKNGQPITVAHLGDVRYGPKTKRGEGSVNGVPAVVFAVMKQPTANTLALTADIDRVLDQLQPSLPAGLIIHKELFRQESFIRAAINNVAEALRDGAILVAIIILLFLANGRATFISLTALPVSLMVAVLALKALGTTLNTMTIMCAWLLTSDRALGHDEGRVMGGLKALYVPALEATLAHGRVLAVVVITAVVAAVGALPYLGRSFLPEFNEGSLTVNAITLAGTSLPMSDRLGRRVEEAMLALPEVKTTTRRTGRAELDEHAQDVNAAEIDVGLDFSRSTRSKEAFLAELRQALARVSGVVVTVGQPLSHRIDHMLSGTRAAIAIKIFGDDLTTLRAVAEQVKAVTEGVAGAVDVSLEQQADIPQIVVRGDPVALARVGMTSGALSEAVEERLAGATVSNLVEQQRIIDVVVKVDSPTHQDMDDVRDLRIEFVLPALFLRFGIARRGSPPSPA